MELHGHLTTVSKIKCITSIEDHYYKSLFSLILGHKTLVLVCEYIQYINFDMSIHYFQLMPIKFP